jgi:hypothetical protein
MVAGQFSSKQPPVEIQGTDYPDAHTREERNQHKGIAGFELLNNADVVRFPVPWASAVDRSC